MSGEMQMRQATGVRPKHIAIVVVVAAAVTVLSTFGIISFGAVPGISAFYIAIGFYTAFCIWFGGWGAIGAVLGACLGSIITGFPIPIAVAIAVPVGFVQTFLPAWAVRGLKMDPRLLTKRDWIIYLVVCVFLAVAIPGVMFSSGLAIFGILPWKVALTAGVFSYIVGDIIVDLIITTPLLKGLSSFVMKTQFYIKGWWD